MTRTKVSRYAILLLASALGVLAGCSRKPTRTDAQIAVEMQNKIYSDSAIQSRQIEVQAANGVVTLSGDVNNDGERALAASDAATVEGVRTVVNNLQVQQATAAPPPVKPTKGGVTHAKANGARHRSKAEWRRRTPLRPMVSLPITLRLPRRL